MTQQRASELLAMIKVEEPNELIVNSWWGSFVKDYKDALQMAIKALEKQPCEDLINQRATTCRHGGHCEWVACDKCNHYEPSPLSQQPCEDVPDTNVGDIISRQAVLEGIAEWVADGYADSEADISHISSLVTHLPSVTPKEKTGHWTRTTDKTGHLVWECGCGWQQRLWTNFCPDCGARMFESQESEKINCKSTKCENCTNHNYCDFESQESEDKE